MSEPGSQQSGVRDQFGPRAAAYLHSAVHANGPEFAVLCAAAQALPGARVLDLGCGAGHVGYRVAPFAAEVVAYDLAPEMLALVADRARALGIGNLHTLCGAVESLPLPDASFDLVLSRYSAHHWADPARALAEARRVLRPGGACIIVDVASPGTALLDTHLQALEVLRDRSHVRDYSAAEWLGCIPAARSLAGCALSSPPGSSAWPLRSRCARRCGCCRTAPATRCATISRSPPTVPSASM